MARDTQKALGESESGPAAALRHANDLRTILALGKLAYRAASLASKPEPKVSTKQRVLQFGVPLAIAAVSWQIRPVIRLDPHAVEVEADREALVADIRERLSTNADVLLEGPDGIVARFAGRAGVLPYRTLELVRFGPDSVDLEHLGGSFDYASERFSLVAGENGRTRMEHAGEFRMRGGLIGWTFGRLAVKPVFERHVAEHMAKTAERNAVQARGA